MTLSGNAARLLALPIRFYRYCISPLLPPACRFVPSCSAYGIEALEKHGPLRGIALALRRLLRCHPWGGSGHDPVPEPCDGRHRHHPDLKLSTGPDAMDADPAATGK